MIPIESCSREERLERALLAIEGLTYLFDDGGLGNVADKVYMIAHAATARCRCPHEDWLKYIEEVEKTCKEAKIMDVEKIMEKNDAFSNRFGADRQSDKDGSLNGISCGGD